MTLTSQHRSLLGLGEVLTSPSATAIPDRYLVPMTKAQIDSFVEAERMKGRDSQFMPADVKNEWAGIAAPTLDIMIEIERHNLYFVNGLIGWDVLTSVYNEAARGLASLPVFPSFKEQLKNSGRFLIGAVAGFITSGGNPVGIFTGGAAAVKKIISDEKARRESVALQQVNIQAQTQKVTEALNIRSTNDALKYSLIGGAVISLATGLYFYLR